jgi:hypothetical protein
MINDILPVTESVDDVLCFVLRSTIHSVRCVFTNCAMYGGAVVAMCVYVCGNGVRCAGARLVVLLRVRVRGLR